ncbi:NAD(P)-binding protein [Lentinula aciculospora]|uniref:NAD(P)-binding protein n=1 Tax=Lentinula aciculospora TaxID=153920 RepID=A0A9W9DYX7_9AGAR|nr:NAD(P)-binding protein [Lentinula aciculospora]
MASVGTVLAQLFPPEAKWSVNNIPDLTGKVAIVTGGNVGLGKATSEKAIAELKEETGEEALFLALDLNDLKAVKEAAEIFKRHSSALHIIICNAGVMVPPVEQLTAQGYDLQFGVNALGHFLFIDLLLPSLKASSNSMSETRIVWVSSSVQYYFRGPPVNYDNLTDTPSRKKLGTQQLYCQSKFITVMLAYHLAKDLADDPSSNVICIVLDPGNIETDLQRHNGPSILRSIMNWIILKPVSKGVLSQLYAATDPEAVQYNGKYLRPWARLGEPHPKTKDIAEQQKIWDYCMSAIRGYE